MHETLDVGSSFSGTINTTVKDEEGDRDTVPKETHYMNANCILLTYFTGDISTVVDDHFSRALSQTTSFNVEGCTNKNISCKGKILLLISGQLNMDNLLISIKSPKII
ncbi:hypothetical protein LOTGIDRAFT_108321 [Lottia gigantea]|uniref:Transcription cofactor vestigial-like protein 2 n=1 Tax=Lottia gigantea TaxID=225164 RepID=V3ZJ38_LOTGI|nr:hypothetical protein LOTGIDRAFT_108321 [Lottia gigantea]ESO84282.1 hypothetical protein LOTGIDRAFT_108321 [Lottia gigantea]